MYQIILTTCPSAPIAEKIAYALVEKQLAACVNVQPTMKSIYRWEGQILSEQEVLLLIKSKQDIYAELEQAIISLHPYDVPEIIAVDIKQGENNYLQWLTENIKAPNN